MTRSVKTRLLVFLVIAAVGIFYVSAAYLGLVDKVLGRQLSVDLDLPASGGLYTGSEVDYRGIQIGKVEALHVTHDGVRAVLQLEPGTQVPKDADVEVHNLSAVGEQYVDFVPTHEDGPYLQGGDVVKAGPEALPESTDQLLTTLSDFTDSIKGQDLTTTVAELGDLFRGNAGNLRSLVDNGTTLVDEASANQKQTVKLLDTGQTVLETQQAHRDDIRDFAKGLRNVTATLKQSDPQLREILQGGTATAQQVQDLVDGLSPVLPVFISNLVTVNSVFTARLPALEQTLVTFPRVVATGFTGSPDGYGHLNMQFNYTTPVCTQGYKPPSRWVSPLETKMQPLYPAKCTDKRAQPGYTGSDPIEQRGVNMVPKADSVSRYLTDYDPKSGRTDLPDGKTVTMMPDSPADQTGLVSVLSDDSWRSIILGSTQ